jgi:hypothetical protein
MSQPINSDPIQIPIQDPLEVACAIGYAVLILGFCFSLLRIMSIHFKEKREETDKKWIVIGQRRIVWELGRMGKERAWAEVERVCGEEWDVGIQEKNVELEEQHSIDKETRTNIAMLLVLILRYPEHCDSTKEIPP